MKHLSTSAQVVSKSVSDIVKPKSHAIEFASLLKEDNETTPTVKTISIPEESSKETVEGDVSFVTVANANSTNSTDLKPIGAENVTGEQHIVVVKTDGSELDGNDLNISDDKVKALTNDSYDVIRTDNHIEGGDLELE